MDITLRLRGKTVADVLTNGHVLRLCATDGTEVEIVWLDDNGAPLKGKPAVMKHGVRLTAGLGLRDILHFPSLLTKGEA